MAPQSPSHSPRIPFGQEFTPSTLGKTLGEDEVLGWLLDTAAAAGNRSDLSAAIQETCLPGVRGLKDRRDMASHVITAMRGYKLIEVDEDDRVSLTQVAQRILAAKGEARDRMFARHILTSCGGQRLVDTILKYQIRGEQPRLEDLARDLEDQPTSKSISAMRAWLSRAGSFEGRGYSVDQTAIESLLGSNIAEVYALQPLELEFVIAVRLLEPQEGVGFVRASEAMSVAEARNPHLRPPRKALGTFVKRLRDREVLEVEKERGAGGTGWAVRLLGAARELTAEEIKSLVEQSDLGFSLAELLPLDQALAELGKGSTHQRGLAGEMLGCRAGDHENTRAISST